MEVSSREGNEEERGHISYFSKQLLYGSNFNTYHLIISQILRSMNYPHFTDEKIIVQRCYKMKGLA